MNDDDLSDFDVRVAPKGALTVEAFNQAQTLHDLDHVDSIVERETTSLNLVATLERFIRGVIPHLDPSQLRQLADHIPRALLGVDADAQAYDANFSVADELTLQIQAVQALRQHVFPGGRFKLDGSVKEAKEVLTTCNQMIKTLIDSHERVMNMERFRAVESATLDVLGEMSDENKNLFLERLGMKLAEIE